MDEFTRWRMKKQCRMRQDADLPDAEMIGLATGVVLLKDAASRYLRTRDARTRTELRRLVRELSDLVG